jgi:2-polyprenyl-3-methyl-5-hydroxy-6-metoxy-1,4-benzoquinol methylase
MSERDVLRLPTRLAPDVLAERLRAYEPWGHRIDFSNGVSTAQFRRRTPFNENLLSKFHAAARHIPFDRMRGGALLDIGCNSGHNSIHAATVYGLHPVGIDVVDRHIQASSFLAELAGIQAEFLIANAETYTRPGAFDVVLHFGTLYHLPNPLLSLQSTFANLRKGGYLALETQTLEHPDDPNLCYFMHMQNNDRSNFWAISEHVLRRYLEFLGFEPAVTALKVQPAMLPHHQYRILLVARKP